MRALRWIWMVPAVLLALLVLLCLTRVGVRVTCDAGGTLVLRVRAGPVSLTLLPARKRKAKPPKAKKKRGRKKKEPAGAAPEKKRKLPPIGPGDIREAAAILLPPLRRALRRTRRGVRVSPLHVSVALAGREDPPAAAELYGRLQAAAWALMPGAERLLDIRDIRIHTEVDFEADTLRAAADIGVSARIGTLLAAALGVGFPALRWLLRLWRKQRPQKPETAPAAAPPH